MANEKKTYATEEQILYANILNKGMLLGLLGLIVTFGIYLSGALAPLIEVGDLPKYWVMPVHEYLELSGVETGWAWLAKVNHGDMLTFVPIAFLSGLTIICYLAVLPGFIRKKDTAYAVLAVIEVLVLCLAASGILASGGH